MALTGITVPISLSFSLQGLVRTTSLQAFAAGAALCSTSLGTTFTILSTSGLTTTRLGVVLTSAAMMDDVVGLVMVQVISNLGGSRSSISPTTVVRPILVSLAFTVVLPLACRYFVKPLTMLLNRHRENNPSGVLQKVLCLRQTAFVIHTAILLGLVTGASYAGTSNLLAAYTAGAIISWWDSELPHHTNGSTASAEASPGQGEDSVAGPSDSRVVSKEAHPDGSEREKQDKSTPAVNSSNVCSLPTSGSAVYERYYQQPVEKILKPLFFVRYPHFFPPHLQPIFHHTTHLTLAGVHRLLNSHNTYVLRPHRLARHCLCTPHGLWQTRLRPLARPVPHHSSRRQQAAHQLP